MLLTVRQVCDRLNVCRSTVWRLAKHNPDFPPAVKVGRAVRYRADQIDAWSTAGGATRPQADGDSRQHEAGAA